jgi:AcrR family transcriptional regulator
MSENKKIEKRVRRTKIAIERDVLKAVDSLIEEVGFSNITLTGVAERAKIEPAVFYRRYANLEELFDKYTHKYDYWFGDILESIPKNLSQEEGFYWVMEKLIGALYYNKGMQQLLKWELVEDNQITRRTARLRESINEPLIRLLEYKFQGSGLDINVIAANVIAGIYYLILHRKRSKFCDVDFTSRQGKARLNNGIKQLIDLLFEKVANEQRITQIAEKLKAEGVSEEIIARCVHRK